MPITGPSDETPAVRASDTEREAVVARLQTAVGEGRIDLEEFAERAELAYAARTTADLYPLTADLPAPGAPSVELVGRSRQPVETTSVFGDITVSGAGDVPPRARTVFGDVRVDLRDLRTSVDVVELQLETFFGDVEVIVAEGVAAELVGRTTFGDRRVQLAPVPRLVGTPLVVVRARSVFGDLRLRSLAPGRSPSRWRAVIDRLAALPPPSLPPGP